ncbi:hypothetical protein [Azospira inquinata]|uniref:Uncharacterized protein n=1 Tax=Azospira inquinata TaxID=2785627 RepID=A0A975SNC6_9RHOO|nr:hypothetical protein [Azospira inquinata]QWT45145.1 hypothetical protein J8L76_09275 [Azospira inquinata]QWT49522.1 hypothetical protein Azoinq_02605 [Azospira inquinata]
MPIIKIQKTQNLLLIISIIYPIFSLADDGYAKLFFICSKSTSNLTVTVRQPPANDKTSVMAKEINWQSLLIEKNNGGVITKNGSKTSTHNCGQATVKIKYGYVSNDFNAASGADDFPLVALHYKKQLIIPFTAMEACDVTDKLAQSAMGDCYHAWAEQISINKKTNLALVTRKITDKTNNTKDFITKIKLP